MLFSMAAMCTLLYGLFQFMAYQSVTVTQQLAVLTPSRQEYRASSRHMQVSCRADVS